MQFFKNKLLGDVIKHLTLTVDTHLLSPVGRSIFQKHDNIRDCDIKVISNF